MPPKKVKQGSTVTVERKGEEAVEVPVEQFDEAEASFGDPVLDAAADVAKEMGGRFTDDLLSDPQALLDAALGEQQPAPEPESPSAVVEGLAQYYNNLRQPLDPGLQPGRVVRVKREFAHIAEIPFNLAILHRVLDKPFGLTTVEDALDPYDCVVLIATTRGRLLCPCVLQRLELHPDFLDFDANN